MKILGLTGYKRSGKDTAAQLVERITGWDCVRVNFADALKQEVAEATGESREFIELHKDNFRHILQGWGTNYKRALKGDSYWTHKWLATINDFETIPALVLVTDVRFLNEAEVIRQFGGKIYRVFNPHTFSDGHPSETELNKIQIDGTFDNSGTIEDLHQDIQIKLPTIWPTHPKTP